MSLKVRRGELRDLNTIVEFNAKMAWETEKIELSKSTLSQGVRAALLDVNKAIYFVAEADDRVVGQLMITHEWSDWRNGDIWWIESVYVDADHRQQGVFRALFQATEQAARDAGAIGLRLYVEHENDAAQKVYDRLGMAMTHYKVMEKIWFTSTDP